jgi:hypothetical protein
MMSRRIRGLRTLSAAGLAVAVLLVTPGPAFANYELYLPDGTVASTLYAPVDYKFSLNTAYWSVLALHPMDSDADADLELRTSGGTFLDGSAWDAGETDFVAVDSNIGRQPYGDYLATATRAAGNGWHDLQLRKGKTTTTLPNPAWDGVSGPGDPDIAFATLLDSELASISDIFLSAGDKFWASSTTAGTHLYLMESSSSNPASWAQSRIEAGIVNTPTVIDNCTLYTAKVTSWHALLMVGDRRPVWNTGGGMSFALHRYDPAKPTTCPIRNFPNPTPA